MKVFKATHYVQDLTLAPSVVEYRTGTGMHYDLGLLRIPITGEPLKHLNNQELREASLANIKTLLARGCSEWRTGSKGLPVVKLSKRSNAAVLALFVPPGLHAVTPDYHLVGDNAKIVAMQYDTNKLNNEDIGYPLVFSKYGVFTLYARTMSAVWMYSYDNGLWDVKELDKNSMPKPPHGSQGMLGPQGPLDKNLTENSNLPENPLLAE